LVIHRKTVVSSFIWGSMYQGWRFSLARREWRVRFSSVPHGKI